MASNDSQKYPPSIQRLFAPKLPVPFGPSPDYAPQDRRTASISPVSAWRDQYMQHVEQLRREPKRDDATELVANFKNAQSRKRSFQQSHQRQIHDWNTAELSPDFRDPYKTVFLARLNYSLTEIELSKHLSKYGELESVKIIRNSTTKRSRGYGFVVFERDSDAKNCVKDLASQGLKIPENGPRTILVDIERSRVVRAWKPRRLGGGLGGRHYTKTGSVASAAASGRRTNLAPNPYVERKSFYQNSQPRKHDTPSYYSGTDQYTKSEASGAYGAFATNAYGSYRADKDTRKTPDRDSKYDKYAKYSASSYKPQTDAARSIRSIRQKE